MYRNKKVHNNPIEIYNPKYPKKTISKIIVAIDTAA